jgi:hypothetical protein
MSSILKSEVLCFPHIEFPDAVWLKGALCVWDRVHRIVPDGYLPRDSDEVKEAIDAGLVVDLRLTKGDLAHARSTFTDFLARKPVLPHALDPAGHLTTTVHRGKIDEQLREEFSQIVGHVHQRDEWLEIPKGIGNGYLLYLAQSVAKRRGMPKITDSDAMFVAMQYFATSRDFKESVQDVHGCDASAVVALRTILPGGLQWAPMERVLKFHKASHDGRAALRGAFESLAEELAAVEEPTYVEEIAHRFKANISQAEGFTMPRIREFFADTGALALQVGLPVAATGVASMLADTSTVTVGKVLVQLVGALAGGLGARRKEWRSAEATYMAKLNLEFDGDCPFPKKQVAMDRLMNEFIND